MSCLPLRERHSANTLQCCQSQANVETQVKVSSNNLNSAGMNHSSLAVLESDFNATSQIRECSASFNDVSSIAENESALDYPMSLVNVDDLMRRAYVTTLIISGGSGPDSPWFQQWEKVVQHSGNHILPGGPAGRRYVDLLTDKIQHLGVGNYPSERVLVFSSVILQWNRIIVYISYFKSYAMYVSFEYTDCWCLDHLVREACSTSAQLRHISLYIYSACS